jgi:hypothetical protein
MQSLSFSKQTNTIVSYKLQTSTSLCYINKGQQTIQREISSMYELKFTQQWLHLQEYNTMYYIER